MKFNIACSYITDTYVTKCRNICVLTDLGELPLFPSGTWQSKYYMKKWSWYVNINFSLYVWHLGNPILVLKRHNSTSWDTKFQNDCLIPTYCWYFVFLKNRWFDYFRHGINGYLYLVIILGHLLWQSIYFCFNVTGYNLHISLSIFKLTTPDMMNAYFRCLVWETAIFVTFKVMWGCLDF